MTSSQITIAVLTGGGLAVASSAHCALMCGPLALATRVRHGGSASLSYYLGRFVSYSALGAIAGGAGRVALLSPWARWGELALSWLLAITLCVAGVNMLRGVAASPLLKLGRRPRLSRAGRMLARVADDPLLLGAATALLPCGALFSGLVAAATLGSATKGAFAMGAFAVMSGIALFAVGQFGRLNLSDRIVRRTIATALLMGSALMFYRPLPSLSSGDGAAPACHGVPLAVSGADRPEGTLD